MLETKFGALSALSLLALLVQPSYQQENTKRVCSVEAAPANPNFKCNYRGVLTNASTPIGDPTTGGTFEECRDSCLLIPNQCRTFGYDSDATTCTLYPKNIKKQKGRPDPNSTTKYWARRCFIPTFYFKYPLANGDFETGDFSNWNVTTDDPNVFLPARVKSNGDEHGYYAYFSADYTEYPPDVPVEDAHYYLNNPNVFFCGGVTYDMKFSVFQVPGSTTVSGPNGGPYFFPSAGGVGGYSGFFGAIGRDFIAAVGAGTGNFPEGSWFGFPGPADGYKPSANGNEDVKLEIVAKAGNKFTLYFDDFQIIARDP